MKNKYIENIRCLLILIYQNIIPNKISAVHLKISEGGRSTVDPFIRALGLYTNTIYSTWPPAAADDGGVGAHGSLVVGLAVGEADQDVYNPGVGQRAKTGQATVQE